MNDQLHTQGPGDPAPAGDTRSIISRRDFLKLAGVTGATVGLTAGLGGALAACGEQSTTTTAGAVPTSGASTTSGPTTTEAVSTTAASAGPEAGRPIKLGVVSPKTGPLALFGQADDWWVGFADTAQGDGIICGDGKLHTFDIKVVDSQSDTNRASQVAGDLITNDKVDMILAGGGPDNINPVADQAETLGCPSISNMTPWQPYFFPRGGTPDKPFKWTYAHAAGLEDFVGNFMAMWEQLSTNKKVGFIFANDADGIAWTDETNGLPPALKAAGYEYVLPQLYPPGTEDFTTYISAFKKAGCEICCGTANPPDFTNFWKQAAQASYQPKAMTCGKALLFPKAVEAVGTIAYDTTCECVWHADWPYKDSITGKTCRELADDFEAKTGEQWTAPINMYMKFEWAVDVFKRVQNMDDKEEVIGAVRTTKVNTIMGLVDFTAPIDMTDLNKSKRPVENIYKAPAAGQQWVKGDAYPFEPVLVSNANNADLPVQSKPIAMRYAS